jgi:uncharacterized protein YjlB
VEHAGLLTQRISMMKAVAVISGKPGSIHLAELTESSVHEIPNGRGYKAAIDSAAFTVVGDKLYLNYSRTVRVL